MKFFERHNARDSFEIFFFHNDQLSHPNITKWPLISVNFTQSQLPQQYSFIHLMMMLLLHSESILWEKEEDETTTRRNIEKRSKYKKKNKKQYQTSRECKERDKIALYH